MFTKSNISYKRSRNHQKQPGLVLIEFKCRFKNCLSDVWIWASTGQLCVCVTQWVLNIHRLCFFTNITVWISLTDEHSFVSTQTHTYTHRSAFPMWFFFTGWLTNSDISPRECWLISSQGGDIPAVHMCVCVYLLCWSTMLPQHD